MMHSDKLAGRLWILAAVLLWSSCGLFVKAGFFDDWPDSACGPLLAFWRSAFAALILLPMIRRPRWNPRLIPLAVCFTAMCITYLTAVTMTTAANAIWLQATSPWWVFLLSVVLLREPVVRRDLIPLGFGVVGVGIILAFELGIHAQDRLGVLCGLASGVCFACVVMFMRHLRHENAAWLVAVSHIGVILVMLPWAVSLGIWPTPLQLVVLAAFGSLQMAIPYVFLIRGLRTISSQEAVGLGLIEPILTPFWVFAFGLETPRWWTVVGGSLILAGLVLRYVLLEWIARRKR